MPSLGAIIDALPFVFLALTPVPTALPAALPASDVLSKALIISAPAFAPFDAPAGTNGINAAPVS